MADPPEMGKLDVYSRTSCTFPSIGPVAMRTAAGMVLVEDGAGCTSILIQHQGAPWSAAMPVYHPERLHGYLVQMDAEAARNIAASLLDMADKMGGKVN